MQPNSGASDIFFHISGEKSWPNHGGSVDYQAPESLAVLPADTNWCGKFSAVSNPVARPPLPQLPNVAGQVAGLVIAS